MLKPPTYEGLKAYILQINQCHWECVREEQAEAKLHSRVLKGAQSSSTTSSSKGKAKASTSTSNPSSNHTMAKVTVSTSGNHNSSGSGNKKKKSEASTSTPKSDISKNLGPDGKLLPEVKQYRINKGLCLLCGQPSHMAAECPCKGRQAVGRAAKPTEQKANAETSGSGSKK